MHTNTQAIFKDLYRLTLAPNEHFEFNQFLVKDQKNCLVHTGKDLFFEPLYQMTKDLLGNESLHYIIFSHYEADECGSVNRWLEKFPDAQVVCNKIANISLEDFLLRPARILKDGESLTLGRRSLTLINTPHFPHNWDAHLWYEPSEKLLFSSDFCCQGGITKPIVETDISSQIIDFYKRGGFIPYGNSTTEALKKLEQYPLRGILPMHGSSILGSVCESIFKNVSADLKEKSLSY
jgi:flavorubredoxin